MTDQHAPNDHKDSHQTKALIDLWPVYLWMFLFMMSNGIGITVMPVLAVIHHMPNSLVGTIGSIYFAGMFMGYFIGPLLVRRKGYHVAGVLLFPLMCIGLGVLLAHEAWLWAVGRCLAGFGVGISYVIAESWVAGRAHASIRMTALSIYIAAAIFGILSAQALLTLVESGSLLALVLGFVILIASSVLLAVVPLPHTQQKQSTSRPGKTIRIIRHASIPLAGIFISGLLFSIFVTFYPAYGADRGLPADLIPVIGVIVMGGAALMQPILGRLLERTDPAVLLSALALLSSASAIGLMVTPVAGLWLYGLVALWGASALTTYPLYGGLAYAALPDESVFDVARAILVSYGVAEIIAPPVLGVAIDAWGVDWIFGSAAFAGLLLLVMTIFLKKRRIRHNDASGSA